MSPSLAATPGGTQLGSGGIPPPEHSFQLVVQDLGPSLQQQMCATLRPVHLLLLHDASAHDVIDRRFDGCRPDPFAVSGPLAEVWDELLVVTNVGLEFSDSGSELLA